MKVTVYTTTDCQYSKQEKDYLVANKVQYEEKNLETNKEFLTEMLALSNNFAGTPVTRVEKDDGSIVVLKGFTKEEFDTTFSLVAETPPKAEETVATADPTTLVVEAAPVAENPPVSTELNSVLDKFEEKTVPVEAPVPTDSTIPPSVPNFPDDAAKTNA